MDDKLFGKVTQGEESMGRIESFLVFPVAALYLAVVPGRVRTDQLMSDAQILGSCFEECGKVPFAVGKPIGKLKSVVSLDTLNMDSTPGIPLYEPFQKIGGRIGGLFRIGSQKAQAGKFVNSSILKQPQLRICDTAAGNHLHIHLDTLTWIGHLFIGLSFVGVLGLFGRKHLQFPHNPEQAFRTAGVATLLQAVPQFYHTELWISAAHIADQLQFRLCVLVRMTVGPSGLAGQGLHTSVPARLPEVDIRPAFVVLSACPADAEFLCILH